MLIRRCNYRADEQGHYYVQLPDKVDNQHVIFRIDAGEKRKRVWPLASRSFSSA